MAFSVSTIDRPLRLRARPDVLAAAVRAADSGGWVVTDPVTRSHFELTDEEQAVLEWLDRGASLRSLQQRFERRFAPRRIEASELWALVSRLHRDGLLATDAEDAGDQLWRRDRQRRRVEWRWAWARLLAIRLPSFNPDSFITALHGAIAWMLGPLGAVAATLLLMAGAGTAVANAGQLAADLPSLSSLTEPQNLLWLAATAVVVKVLHELGHAVACKHFGGEVREMGVMLLALAPCLYCDVSDMWRLPSRWRRMAVTAAGMGVELLLAALAVIVWRWAAPGLVKSLAVSVMIVCTVGTLLVNANPLLRFDGYYLLSDLTGTSNLWQRSREALRSRVAGWFTKQPATSASPKTNGPTWLAAYGVASTVYVGVVVASIGWLLLATLKPMGLESLGWGLAAVCLASAAVEPARRAARWARDPAARLRVRRGRATMAAVLLAALVAGVLQAPWSYTVQAPAEVTLDGARPVVVTIGGLLVEAVAAGEKVAAGDILARLANPEVEREVVQLEGRVAEQQRRIDQLEALRSRDAEARDSLPSERALLEDLRGQLADRRADAKRLVLRALEDGVVIAAPDAVPTEDDETTLPRWGGSPLARENRGAWLEPGDVVCLIGEPGSVAVQAALSEADIERLATGQPARVALGQTPGRVLHGRVTEVARNATPAGESREPTAALSNWSPLKPPTAAPVARYQVRVELEAHDEALLAGGVGRMKIDTGRTTLGRWLADGLSQAFRLP